MSNIPHMATIKQTAKETGLAEHFIRQLCISKKIVAIQAGKKWLINTDRLVDFLNAPPQSGDEAQAEKIRRIV